MIDNPTGELRWSSYNIVKLENNGGKMIHAEQRLYKCSGKVIPSNITLPLQMTISHTNKQEH